MVILELLSRKAAAKKIDFLVIGGHAVAALGISRQTGDVDLLVCEGEREIWKSLLEDLGYKCFHDHPVFLQFTPPELGAWPVDLMCVNRQTFEQFLEESEFRDFDGTKCKVPSVTNLLALKLHSLKSADSERELKDVADILQITKQAGIDVGAEEFKNLCIRFASETIYGKIKSAKSDS